MDSKWKVIVKENFNKETEKLNLSIDSYKRGNKSLKSNDIPEILEACQEFQELKGLWLCKNINI